MKYKAWPDYNTGSLQIENNDVPQTLYKAAPLLANLCYDQGEAAEYLYPQRPPTSRQGRQVRVTTCRDHVIYDHMIYTTQGHVTFEPGEPTGGMARRAQHKVTRLSSQASQQEGWLDELAF